MKRLRFQSLQLRLAVRLAALYLIVAVLIFGVLAYRAYQTAGTLNNRELSQRAADLAHSIRPDAGGVPRLELSPELQAAYQAVPRHDMFAVRDAANHIVAALPPDFGELVRQWPTPSDDPDYFRIAYFGTGFQDYYGLNIALQSEAGAISISVAKAAGADALIESVVRDFVVDIAWIIPLIVLLTIVIGTFVIRSVLKPVDRLARIAKTIGPNTTRVRLSGEHLPSEIAPLVGAVNRALDRLDQGFAVQRQFTANAAHELRTPLAIITAALDDRQGDNGEMAKLKADVVRMNRLVEQLLRVARLDAVALDVSQAFDLNELAADIVETMAPWALAKERMIAFQREIHPVTIHGNAHAVGDAIRNLIENAVIHTLPHTEVRVRVRHDRRIEVVDRGPGVDPEDRSQIFQRFWRGKNNSTQGAGLGLAIVKEIMMAHGGNVRVGDDPGGGAVFTLEFPLAGNPGDRRSAS